MAQYYIFKVELLTEKLSTEWTMTHLYDEIESKSGLGKLSLIEHHALSPRDTAEKEAEFEEDGSFFDDLGYVYQLKEGDEVVITTVDGSVKVTIAGIVWVDSDNFRLLTATGELVKGVRCDITQVGRGDIKADVVEWKAKWLKKEE